MNHGMRRNVWLRHGAVALAYALGYVLLFVAAAFAAMNVTGGYLVTDRMLEIFKARPRDVRR